MTPGAAIDRRRLIFGVWLTAAGCTGPSDSARNGLEDIPITLTPDLAGQESAFRADLRGGHAILLAFARANGLGDYMQLPLIIGAEVFGSKPAFDARLRAIRGQPADYAYSPTTVGSLISNVLYVCSEAATRAADPRQATHEDYLRLIAHEIGHALHDAVLGGGYGGPRWFREGFPVMAAGQFAGASIDRRAFETLLTRSDPPDYPLFGAAVRKLAEVESVPALISRASGVDFAAWALSAARF